MPQSGGRGGSSTSSSASSSSSSSLYARLGVDPTASASQIAAAFRSKAHELHPDRTGCDGEAFKQLSDAYQVLRDPAKRASYDQALNGGGGGGWSSSSSHRSSSSSASAYPRPGESFDDAFERWWKAQGFGTPPPPPNDEAARRAAAEARAAAAAAWEEEKLDAREAKRRGERVRARAEHARAARHAETLRGFWQASRRLQRADGVAAFGLVSVLVGVAWAWPEGSERRGGREEEGVGKSGGRIGGGGAASAMTEVAVAAAAGEEEDGAGVE